MEIFARRLEKIVGLTRLLSLQLVEHGTESRKFLSKDYFFHLDWSYTGNHCMFALVSLSWQFGLWRFGTEGKLELRQSGHFWLV